MMADETRETKDKCDKSIADTLRALQAVMAVTQGARGVHGTITCPICGGDLRYSVAASNGHVWGACSTSDCVRWM